ncbi:MAG: sugar phosphate isomerase/epimerase [Clostridia bacterium]|nr:sugar phosphate isomerase/epimerase [Clostridia bacterium]
MSPTRKLLVNVTEAYGDSPRERLETVREAGFDGFFTMWGPDVPEYRREADRLGLTYGSVHAPFGKIVKMWGRGEETDEVLSELLDCIDGTADAGVPATVCHVYIGFDFDAADAALREHKGDALRNFAKVAERSEKRGITVAFENTEGEEHMRAVMDSLKDCPSVGFCWDVGHEICYNGAKDQTALYGDRLAVTHLNDNFGATEEDGVITWRDDLHLLPFDGKVDWESVARRLIKCGFGGPLTFELKKADTSGRAGGRYDRLTPFEYLTEAHKRAVRVRALLNERKAFNS